jgi:hypothetical protein
MNTDHSHNHTVRVLVTDELADSAARRYESPPQPERQARELVGILVGAACGQAGPWRQAIPGGTNDRTPSRPMTACDDLDRYQRILADPPGAAGRLLEIRAATTGGGIRQTFIAATRTGLAADTITRLAAHTDVYVGVLLRRRRGGGRAACERSQLAFVEIDQPDAAERLARHPCPPTIVIASGGTPGHAHAYWQLDRPLNHDQLEATNRSLALGLDGDQAATDAARILRPPGTRNWKHTPPTAVELLELRAEHRYTPAELTDAQPESAVTPRPTRAPPRTANSERDRLLATPAATYVRVLSGREPNRAGKIHCPFHDDHTPSLQLYQHDWYCYGAWRTGGSIYDFAARLWQLDTRGSDFHELRTRPRQLFPAGASDGMF